MAMWFVFGVISLLIALISILLPVALVVALQVWLCKRKTRWLGLILPVLSFLFSLLLVFGLGAFGLIQTGSGGSMTLDENGQVVQQTITENGMITTYDGEGNIIEQHPDPDAQETPTPRKNKRLRKKCSDTCSPQRSCCSWWATSPQWCWGASGSTTRTAGTFRTS